MLVLSRRPNEKIYVCVPGMEPIVVTLVDVRGDRARLGFDAPDTITINRSEIYDQIGSEKTKAHKERQERR